MSYPAQLKHKSGRVKKIMINHDVDKIIGMDDPWHYRNKCISSFSFNKIVSSGFYQMYSHDIVNIAECKVQHETIDPIIETINQLATSGKLRIFNEDTENGFLRHVQIRTGFKSKEVMVVIVAASKIFPGKNKFIKALIERHPEIKTVLLNVNKRTTSIVLGEQEIVLYGPGYIRDELCGLKFNISAKSFYQINPVQTEKLYNLALEMADLNEDDIVVDTYSGIGTITLIAAQKAKQVFGVEISKDAIKNSIRNAKLNQIKNVRFVEGDAGEVMVQMAEEEVPVTTVFMDPPRAGSDEQFLTSLVELKPKQIIYISCNPVTQKRDMDYLLKKGYRVEKLVPIDMFPMTNHVESIAKLVRKK
jgi:23S rRNA (uracil1939-C5)-methyltransferase